MIVKAKIKTDGVTVTVTNRREVYESIKPTLEHLRQQAKKYSKALNLH